jgi:MtN3 and saliva related transmembrane protein
MPSGRVKLKPDPLIIFEDLEAIYVPSRMNFTSILGIIAGTLTTIAFFPQAYKTWRTRSAKDISLKMFSLLCTGILLWLIYGFLVNDLPIILANSFTLVLASSILIFKLKYPGK